MDASGWKAEDGSHVYAYIVVPVDGETGLYKILLNNVGIESYKENYGLTIQAAPVDDFVAGSYTRVRNFQFEGGVYYEIGNAFDWDLFFGSNEATATTSQLVKVAKVISELKDSDYTVNGSGDDATVTIKSLTVADFKYNAANYANDVNTVYPGTKAAAAHRSSLQRQNLILCRLLVKEPTVRHMHQNQLVQRIRTSTSDRIRSI